MRRRQGHKSKRWRRGELRLSLMPWATIADGPDPRENATSLPKMEKCHGCSSEALPPDVDPDPGGVPRHAAGDRIRRAGRSGSAVTRGAATALRGAEAARRGA